MTYFFNGGREEPFEGEERAMLPSPKDVPTYDQKPEMSAAGVAEAVVEAIRSGKFDFVLVNFANPDMVGHTGVLDAAIHAVEAVDAGVGAIVAAARGAGRRAHRHGRSRQLRADEGPGDGAAAHGAHAQPGAAPLRERRRPKARASAPGGRICDVAPTMLELLGLPQPAEMTGRSLLA